MWKKRVIYKKMELLVNTLTQVNKMNFVHFISASRDIFRLCEFLRERTVAVVQLCSSPSVSQTMSVHSY